MDYRSGALVADRSGRYDSSPDRTSSPAAPPTPVVSPATSVRVARRTLEPGVDAAVTRSVGRFRALQHADGHWCGELEGDTILESEYVLLQVILGRLGDARIGKCAKYLLARQNAEGGWANYPGGTADASVSVKAYFALKLAGHDPTSAPMTAARECIHRLGGAGMVNSFTRFYLAALGQIPYEHCPSVPPELALLPKWFPLNLYAMSSWTRTIVVPLALFCAHRHVTAIPESLGIAELYRVPPTKDNLPPVARIQGRLVSWANFFRLCDRAIKLYERIPNNPLRRRGVEASEKWMLARFAGSDGLGAIYPPMVYSILALRVLGYAEDSSEVRWAEKQLDDLIIEEDGAMRLQPCVSPVWDTLWTMLAFADADVAPDDASLTAAADWLLDREISRRGDWTVMNPHLEPGGWAFEYNNQFYPDLDDTALALMVLDRTARRSEPKCRQATERAKRFLLGMQGSDAGWAAFDRDIDNEILEHVPFADHNAMLDPSCPDITARVLEVLGNLGHTPAEDFVGRAADFLLAHQEPEGCWYGRWGVNYVYGTWQTLLGLQAVGFDMADPRTVAAADWLEEVQQDDGGWGESCASYDDRDLMGQGQTTASQTAWAVMGLLAAGRPSGAAVRKGIAYLVRTQRPDGEWDEEPFTGTGFPKVFYLKYHYYRLYFPLLALGRYRRALRDR